ncbi:TRAP transporter small permease [Pacificibacter marinus]|uniref:TRAP transporter small permease protein n=1 Tax=Pacificibacter marinus TaxID=658057 RepID=A0A1Y5RJA6_9RHOB|nr:TRAP transporter small permease [Pacificibacter marinus]SEK21542.1 TRAP-type C4-dicarboxylate transport system, small permease component [Pacificibacter marinus]SLN16187.1 Sialic acid TRAP transporter permease protein SiaT [Pacificibacter marinus]
MLNRFCNGVSALVEGLSWIAFALLIATVALQILARNVLNVPMIWTSDLALLFFTWLVFIGAASGLRTGAHYMVDMLPTHRPRVALLVELLSIAAGFCVVWILGVHGWTLAQMRASGEIQSLGLSRFWMYFALPVSGWLMALYLVEMTLSLIRDPFQHTNGGNSSVQAGSAEI